MNTELLDRILWFDGEITINPSSILQFMDYANRLNVTEMTDEISQYNKLMSSDEQINVKNKLNNINHDWNIPEKYKKLNVFRYILDKMDQTQLVEEYSQDEFDVRMERTILELQEFKRLNLIPLLRTLIFIINTFEQNDVVWGPGRGSSVSSFVLYLIGVHDVDSVTFDLDISDFMKDIQ